MRSKCDILVATIDQVLPVEILKLANHLANTQTALELESCQIHETLLLFNFSLLLKRLY